MSRFSFVPPPPVHLAYHGHLHVYTSVERPLFLPTNDDYHPVSDGIRECIMPLIRVKVAGSLDAASLA
jgi:hypothetical protein